MLVADAAWASLTGALSGGVVLLAFALALGAGPLVVGLLAAIPFLTQVFQLPALALVERVRQRKRIGVIGLTIARALILLLALLPFMPVGDGRQLALLITAHLLISALGSIASCAINSWFHQLLPPDVLGVFFARRLLLATALACVGTLAAGLLVDHLPFGNPLHAYAIAFAAAGIAGFASSFYLARSPEPQMHDAGPPASLVQRLRVPLQDANFRSLLVLLGAWNLASNLAAPFLTVYLLQQLGYSLTVVTTLWVTSQLANALTLLVWGRVSDRLSNKAVLVVALPAYFACMAGLVFTRVGEPYGLQLALLYLLHVVMGAASGGIALATGNLGLKLAPQGQGTAYLAAIGLICAFAGGLAPLAGGAIAQWFELSQLSVVVRWVSPMREDEVSLLRFSHMEFLFALSALLGLYVLHALSRVREGDEVSERQVVQELALEALRTVNHLSSVGGLLGSLVSFERLSERRMFSRLRRKPPAS
ncbi:MAG: MFS transporter [Methylibium sp.]|uniref:MFS transporter n=1 Tax=Methylibium sp. TaxID=2067992 RepID=UPI0017D14EFD|nr:MFS transporter [Methylibium sp.]MBA3597708.1 MFS transporter [Methylibium sp.]